MKGLNLSPAPPPPAQVIVAAAIVTPAVRPGDPPRLLAAQRAYPPGLAGRWELPGGKVEAGEDELAALVRECREELGVTVVPGERVGADVPIPPGRVLRVWAARVAAGEPQPREHAALRWLRAGELDGLDWLPADRPLVPALRDLLRRSAR